MVQMPHGVKKHQIIIGIIIGFLLGLAAPYVYDSASLAPVVAEEVDQGEAE